MSSCSFNCCDYRYQFQTKGFVQAGIFCSLGLALLLINQYYVDPIIRSDEATISRCFHNHNNTSLNLTTQVYNETLEFSPLKSCWELTASKILKYSLEGFMIGSFISAVFTLVYHLKLVATPDQQPLLQRV